MNRKRSKEKLRECGNSFMAQMLQKIEIQGGKGGVKDCLQIIHDYFHLTKTHKHSACSIH